MEPNPSQVAPWYLRNITQALELDQTTGNVFVRTGLASGGNIIITGNVTIPGTIDTHIVELGNITITGDTLPVSGNVGILGNVNVTQGTDPWKITGNVNAAVSGSVTSTLSGNLAGITANVTVVDGGGSLTVDGNVNVTGGNISVTGNVTTPTDITQADSTYWMNVTRGLISGQYLESKNGYRTAMDQSVEASLWSGPTTLYPWSSWTVAQPLYIVSTNAGDVQTLTLDGLDSSYTKFTEVITLIGTTPVVTANNFLRLNRCSIISGTANTGTVTMRLGSGAGTVVGQMDPGFSRIKGGYVTIPKGYTGYLLNMSATQFRGGSGNIGGVLRLYSHLPNNAFILQVIAEVVNGQWSQELTYPLICPQYMDIDFRMVPDGNGTQGTCFYQLLYIAM